VALLSRISERFWFVPALMCVAAFALAESLVRIDERLGDLNPPPWVDVLVYRVGESGSRDVLGAIATSALAVAGTTFSITIAVLALTSSTYGPRLVRNFMADRGNQTVLGVYVATFLYSLLVLRAVRVLGDPGDQEAEVFVPHLAVNMAVFLGVANVAVLVWFIHHISDSIQITTLSGEVRRDLRSAVDRLYPEEIGLDETADEPQPLVPEGSLAMSMPVPADRSGYVQKVDEGALMELAVESDAVVALSVGPGSYVLDGVSVATVHSAGGVGDEVVEGVRAALTVGDARTPKQDLSFTVEQLVEMAVRALSPGTNDPFTAINALDDLSSGLSLFAGRRAPSSLRRDRHGAVRVYAPRATLVEQLDYVLDHIRWYGSAAPSVLSAALVLIDRVGARTREQHVRARLAEHVTRLLEAYQENDPQACDLDALQRRAGEVLERLGVMGPERPAQA
jgi:uncharacterized membrane protein